MTRTRPMTQADLELVLDWAAEEGWNPGVDDAEAFFAADPGGFFVAEADGGPVAAISVVNHNAEYAFLGLYLCRPSHRGQGIGFALWQHALLHAGDRTIGLDGVPEQQDNYVKSGFVIAGSTTRYLGVVPHQTHASIRPARRDDTDALIALEALASGQEKPAYLAAWFAPSGHRKTFVLEVGGEPKGLITVRKCRTGAKLGPLVAANADAALALVRHAANVFGDTVILDVPASSETLDALSRSLGLEPVFHTARMYRGTAVVPGASCYAVASLELG